LFLRDFDPLRNDPHRRRVPSIAPTVLDLF
jgi:hypothetical protein